MRKISYTLLLISCIVSLPAMAQWSLTGNSGTTPGTNFVGTTSNVGLMFKANSVQSGYLDIANTNTSFGYNAMSANTTGNTNTAFGTGALALNTSGTNNLAIGTYALVNSTTASYNLAIGRQSMPNLTSGTFNTAVGYQSLFTITTGSENTVLGFQSLYGLTTGTYNTVIGYNNAGGLTTGNYNTILGCNVSGISSSLSNNIILADGQGNQRINVNNLGYVGIGVASPTAQLHTTGTVLFAGLPNNTSPARVVVSDGSGNLAWEAVSSFSGGGSSDWTTSGTSNIVNSNAGVVIIGSVPTTLFSDPNLKLAVNGDVYSQKVVVTATGWSDYVFDPGYKLVPLKELEAYVNKNRHLPDVPTSSDVEKNGVDVAVNQNILLKKVEELTLYTIEQDKKAEAQQKLIDDQYKMLMEMKAEIEELKKHQQ